jgi:hypothetical protein
MKLLLFLITINCLLSIAAIPPQVVTWTQPIDPTTAQSYTYKLYITEESGVKRTIVLTNTLCGAIQNGSQCSTALPSSGNVATVTGNVSYLTATNPVNGIEGPPSTSFTGNQGCIFRDNLYKVGQQTTGQANKNTINALYSEFQAAKFKFISVRQKGNQYVVTEECAGYIIH